MTFTSVRSSPPRVVGLDAGAREVVGRAVAEAPQRVEHVGDLVLHDAALLELAQQVDLVLAPVGQQPHARGGVAGKGLGELAQGQQRQLGVEGDGLLADLSEAQVQRPVLGEESKAGGRGHAAIFDDVSPDASHR